MKAGNINIRKRTLKNGSISYEYKIEIDPTIDPKTGKEKRQYLYQGGFKLKRDAQNAAKEAIEEYYNSGHNNNHHINLDFSTLVELYLNYVLEVFEPTTYCMYKSYCDKYFIPAFGTKNIKNISPHDIDLLLADMMNNEKNLSQSRIDTAKIVLNQIFSLAIRDNYLLTNPVEHATIKLRGKKPKEKIPYTSEQVYMILDYCGEESIYRIVFVLEVFCGLRIGEVLGLDWENVDFENKTIAIEEQMSNVRYEGKSFQVLKRPKS